MWLRTRQERRGSEGHRQGDDDYSKVIWIACGKDCNFRRLIVVSSFRFWLERYRAINVLYSAWRWNRGGTLKGVYIIIGNRRRLRYEACTR